VGWSSIHGHGGVTGNYLPPSLLLSLVRRPSSWRNAGRVGGWFQHAHDPVARLASGDVGVEEDICNDSLET
jgi:hypothetical protein